MNKQTTPSGLLSFWVLLTGLAIIILSISFAHAASPQGRSVAIDRDGTEFNLRWMGITNALYEPQIRTNLVHGNWDFLSTVIGTDGEMIYPVSSTNLPSAFFRVLFPQPVVTAGEPARYAQGAGGSYIYITGQYFYSGDQVRVGGILANNAERLSPSLLRVELPPGLPPGRHDVEILSNTIGAVLASLHEAVTVVDPLADPDRLLYGPPEEPLASPMGLWLSKKGYEYYKAKSDLGSAGLQNNPYFKSNDLQGEMPRTEARKGISEKGLPPSAMSAGFEVVEGKKGLNAVNVKLARMAGGGNIGSSAQDGFNARKTRKLVATNIGSSGQDGVSRNIGSSGQDGVSLFSGDVQDCVVDMAIPGRGLDFVWARSYHSRLGRTYSSATNGWTFSYDIYMHMLGDNVMIHNGTGRADRYTFQTNGVYTCPEFFCEGTLSANVFRLTFADTGYWEFRSLTATSAPGKLDRIVDRNGNTVSMTYDTAGRLSGIVDTLGRAYTVGYDTQGRITSVTDFSERTIRYEYDGNNDLVTCISPPVTGTPTGNDFPNGKTNSYTYTSGSTIEAENHLLTSCSDGLGQTTAQYGYDLTLTSPSYLRCTSILRGTYQPTRITYQTQIPSTNNQFAALRCIMNDPVGNVTEMLFDSRGRGIDKKDIRRRAEPGTLITDTSTLPIDKLRQDDPDSTVTRWSWNNDSLCTSATAPGGQVVRYTYQGDLDPSTPARKRADCRVVSERSPTYVDLDGDGTPDTNERVWSFDYDPRFGSAPVSGKGWDGTVKGLTASKGLGGKIRGWDGTIKGNAARKPIKEECDDDNRTPADGFVTSATNPRGVVTVTVHDDKGNPTNKAVLAHSGYLLDGAGAPVQRFTYDSYGQLTSMSHAADANGYRRVDTFSYYENGPQTGYLQSIAIDEPGVHLTTAFEYDTRGNLTRCVDPSGNDWLYTYNSLDQCVRSQSPTNISARCSTGFFYDANDNLVRCVTQVRDASDALTGTCTDRASFDPLHRLTEIVLAVDATHALTNRFVYDGNGQCTQILGGDAVSGVDPHHTVSFQYDTCGLLYREVAAPDSADQCTTQYDYDPNGLVTRVSEGLEETPSITTLAYDGFANDVEWEKWEGFSAKGTLKGNREAGPPSLSEIVGLRSSRTQKAKAWMVNNFAALSGSTKGEGRTSVPRKLIVLVGGPDRPSQITDPMGNVTTFHHDANDNLTVVRQYGQLIDMPGSDGNVRLAESRFTYDGIDRCVVQRDLHFALAAPQSPVGDGECTTTFAYAPNGACIGITNDVGLVTLCDYDTAGRVYRIRKVDKGPVITTSTRLMDPAGNVTSITQTDTPALGGQQQSFTRTYVYDSQDRCVSTTDGVGKTDACAYDSLSRVVRSTDAAGTQTFHHYDLLGRCTATVGDLDGDGLEDFARDITEQATWSSSNGRLLATTDSHGNTTSYAYDSRNRCVAVTCADGTQQQLIWSPKSNVIREIDPNGTTIMNSYDACGRVTNRVMIVLTDGVENRVATTTTFENFGYDSFGRLTRHQDDDCDGDFAYDSLGSCVSETLNGLATTSTYDALGNRLSLTYPSGRLLEYTYDASGSCTNISEASSSLARFAYDGEDRLARVTYGNGLSSTFSYDGLDGVPNDPGDHGFGQVSHVVQASSNGTPVKISHLSWDLKQNKAGRIMPPTGTGVSTNVLTLEYDRADRLVRSTVTEGTTTLRDTTYSLDRMGNRTNLINAAGLSGTYTLDPASPPADFQMNQYTVTPGDSRAYDENGNLVSRNAGTASSLIYTYDYADRLVSVSNFGQPVASYTYDALGRRASKTVYIPGEPTPTSRILRMVHDRDRVIEEREDDVVVQSYVQAGNRLIGLRSGTTDYFVLADDQGNADLLTDSSGALVEGYDYDDYGAVTFLTSDGTPLMGSDGQPARSSAFDNPYCWGGLRLDAETGLHNDDGGEYFEPQAGRAVARRPARTGRNPQTGKTIQIKATMTQGGEAPPSVASKHYITIPHNQRVPCGPNGNNPWSGGTPLGMKTGTVKFFNDAKGF